MKLMNTVNYYLIACTVGYLEIAALEAGAPLELLPNDEFSMKQAFARQVKPGLEH
jgi:hypothetical protein